MPPEKARDNIIDLIHDSPQEHGLERSRWSLRGISEAADWLQVETEPGVYQILTRLGVSYKKGRLSMSSPDPDYKGKSLYIQRLRQKVANDPDAVVLYQDELTYYRTPSLDRTYQPQGQTQSKVSNRPEDNKKSRVIAAMEPSTGQVAWRQWGKCGVEQLLDFYQLLVDTWRDKTIYLVQDNWPSHFHQEVMGALTAQRWPFEFRVLPNWPNPEPIARKEGDWPIQLVGLPTYAPWLNPIEKLWRWLKQEVLHMHHLADRWNLLKARVGEFLDRFAHGSDDLRRYVGLLPG